ncbi:MAG: aspartyl protease family protein [Cyclobacteriaceae bacterium]|nr:aspartyl protease family protein [Cyclobacteriaceae bacterium]
MRIRFKVPLLVLGTFFLLSNCTVKWTKAIQRGHISQKAFNEHVKMEIKNGLIFVPVKIDNVEYRFLFDSGAPFSISEELQRNQSYKVISHGNIVDSDKSKKRIDWVQVDSIKIGSIDFVNQTAFIGDFNANPKLECLGFDGIIGSNLMRHCNWTIDQEKKELSLSNAVSEEALNNSVTIPFDEDNQYSMFINFTIGRAKLSNILIDYGSNGSIALSKKAFDVLKKNGIVDKTFLESGAQQNGVVGAPVDINHEIALSDSVQLDTLKLLAVELKTGKSDMIGNQVLSRFKVTIDWDNKVLHLQEPKLDTDPIETFGFRIGYTNEKGVHIQSVIENSIAFKKGIKPNMKVTKVDGLDFENGSSFCDYFQNEFGPTIRIELIDFNGDRKEFIIEKTSLDTNS